MLPESIIKQFGEYKHRESENEYRFVCPKCGGALNVNVVKGVCRCFSCGYGKGIKLEGALVSPSHKYNGALHEKVANWIIENLTLTPNHAKYLKERFIQYPKAYGFRSIDPLLQFKLVKVFGIEYLSEAGLIKQVNNEYKLCKALEPNRIFFPYWFGDRIVGFKSRQSILEDLISSGTFRYCYPPSTEATQYPFYYHEHNGPIVFTEGEIKSLRAGQLGYFSWSFPGINPSDTCISNTLEHLTKFKDRQRFLVFDSGSDIDNHLGLITATLNVSRRINAVPVILPRIQQKLGLDDYLDLYDEDDFDDLLYWSYTNRGKIHKWLKARKVKLQQNLRK